MSSFPNPFLWNPHWAHVHWQFNRVVIFFIFIMISFFGFVPFFPSFSCLHILERLSDLSRWLRSVSFSCSLWSQADIEQYTFLLFFYFFHRWNWIHHRLAWLHQDIDGAEMTSSQHDPTLQSVATFRIINLSTAKIVLSGTVLTVLENLCVPNVSFKSPMTIVMITIAITVTLYTVKEQLPFTTKRCYYKLCLITRQLDLFAEFMKNDIWISVIILLLSGWILNIWENGISFVWWCFIVWIYNLKDGVSNETETNKTDNIPVAEMGFKYTDDSRVQIETDLKKNQYTPVSHYPSLIDDGTSHIAHINSLEKKLLDLETRLTAMENEKVQQNIMIYSFNHSLSDKLNTFDKHIQEKDQRFQAKISQIQAGLKDLENAHCRHLHLHILVNFCIVYIKERLVGILPSWITTLLKGLKRLIKLFWGEIRATLFPP